MDEIQDEATLTDHIWKTSSLLNFVRQSLLELLHIGDDFHDKNNDTVYESEVELE